MIKFEGFYLDNRKSEESKAVVLNRSAVAPCDSIYYWHWGCASF